MYNCSLQYSGSIAWQWALMETCVFTDCRCQSWGTGSGGYFSLSPHGTPSARSRPRPSITMRDWSLCQSSRAQIVNLYHPWQICRCLYERPTRSVHVNINPLHWSRRRNGLKLRCYPNLATLAIQMQCDQYLFRWMLCYCIVHSESSTFMYYNCRGSGFCVIWTLQYQSSELKTSKFMDTRTGHQFKSSREGYSIVKLNTTCEINLLPLYYMA